ncbi:CPK28, partial [Symbiodinium pilosum]
LERLLPDDWSQEEEKEDGVAGASGQAPASLVDFCDAFLVSEKDSTLEEEARIPICCTAIRARLAMQDGTDSPVWRAFSAQVVRLRPESVAIFNTEALEV